MTLVVRPARPEEYAEAGRITVAGYQADDLLLLADGTTDTAYEALLAGAAQRAGEAELLVAVEGGQLLGTVTWCPPGSIWRQLAQAPDEGEFRMLSVAAAGRRRGVGAALVEACLERARSARMRQVVLLSLPRMTAAHRLYARYGFVRDNGLDYTPYPQVDLWGFRLVLDQAGT